MVITQETILDSVKRRGPLLPIQLAKMIGTDSLIASAHLSNLVDKKMIVISNLKVGGSPVYYTPGQENQLQQFISNLNNKDQETINLLKENKILRDDELDNLRRVSLRTIKDFAFPLQVTINNQKILFWKWYMVSNQEAEGLIKNKLGTNKKKLEEERLLEKKKQEEQNKLEEEKKRIDDGRKLLEKKRKEEQNKLDDQRKKLQQEFDSKKQILLKELESKKQEPITKIIKEKPKQEDLLFNKLMNYLKNKKIELVEHKTIRKNSDIDMILKIPSVVGDLQYYCKAKDKKSVTDSDLSSAVIQGQLKKLPVLFLTTGKLNKKAMDLLNTELKKSIIIKNI